MSLVYLVEGAGDVDAVEEMLTREGLNLDRGAMVAHRNGRDFVHLGFDRETGLLEDFEQFGANDGEWLADLLEREGATIS